MKKPVNAMGNVAPKNKPSIGRIVHYVDEGNICRAAIITEVFADYVVALTVFLPYATGGSRAWNRVGFNEIDKSWPSWHWPEKVE